MRIFEVETLFKNGVTRTDFIEAKNENEVWEKYDKYYDEEIESSAIVDDWVQTIV